MAEQRGFDYQRYLASREWAVLKEQVRKRSRGRCEHCIVGKHQDTHHLSYSNIGHESITDLLGVCRPCHEWLSARSSENPLREWFVVSIPLAGKYERENDMGPYHHLIPFTAPDGFKWLRVEVRSCRGPQCIWCTYVDDDWPMYLSSLGIVYGVD